MHLSAKDCEAYYCIQVGGGGPYFYGIRHQRGYGFFGDLRRYLTPMAVKAARYLGRNLLYTGKNIIDDVSSGTSLKDSTRNRFRETSAKMKKDILDKLSQHGRGKKSIKRKREEKSRQIRSKRCKPAGGDIFSL